MSYCCIPRHRSQAFDENIFLETPEYDSKHSSSAHHVLVYVQPLSILGPKMASIDHVTRKDWYPSCRNSLYIRLCVLTCKGALYRHIKKCTKKRIHKHRIINTFGTCNNLPVTNRGFVKFHIADVVKLKLKSFKNENAVHLKNFITPY